MKTGVCTFTDENRSKVRKPLKLGADVTASDKHTTKCSLWLKCCSPVWYKILKPQPSLIRDFILCHSTESRLQICNEKRTKERECVWVTYAEIKEIWNESFFVLVHHILSKQVLLWSSYPIRPILFLLPSWDIVEQVPGSASLSLLSGLP